MRFKKMSRMKITLIAMSLIVLCLSLAVAQILMTHTFNFSGHITAQGEFTLYTDQALTIPFTGFDFGNYSAIANEDHMISLWIKSKSNVDGNLTWTANYFSTYVDNTLKNTVWLLYVDLLNKTTFAGLSGWYPTNCTNPILINNTLVKLLIGEATCIKITLRALAGSLPSDIAFIQTISLQA